MINIEQTTEFQTWVEKHKSTQQADIAKAKRLAAQEGETDAFKVD